MHSLGLLDSQPGLQRSRLQLLGLPKPMTNVLYDGDRFPPEIIQQAIWLYLRFTLKFRNAEVLLAERGIAVSYETIRR